MPGNRGDEAGDAALHVDCAAAVHLAVLDGGGEGRVRPGCLVTDGNDIRMAGKHQVRPVARTARIEVFDIGRAGLRKDRPLDRKTERSQHVAKGRQRTGILRRHRSAADEGGEICDGIDCEAHVAGIIQSAGDVTVIARPVQPRASGRRSAAFSIIVIFCQILRDRLEPSVSMSLTASMTTSSLTDWAKRAASLPVIDSISEQ